MRLVVSRLICARPAITSSPPTRREFFSGSRNAQQRGAPSCGSGNRSKTLGVRSIHGAWIRPVSPLDGLLALMALAQSSPGEPALASIASSLLAPRLNSRACAALTAGCVVGGDSTVKTHGRYIGDQTISRIIAENDANVTRVDHSRVGAGLTMGGVHITIDMETRGRDHSEQILEGLREGGYEAMVQH